MPREAVKPHVSEILQAEDGPIIMVRAAAVPEAIAIAHEEAAADDYVICDPESVRLEWIRAMPCVPRSSGGHEIDGGWCEGGYRCHYVPGKPGRGAFRGAFIDITYADELEDDDPLKAPYLAACAGMEGRAAEVPGMPVAECPESKMGDGRHAADYEDSGSCPWCGAVNPGAPR